MDKILEIIKSEGYKTIGIPGSKTIRQIGIISLLEELGLKIIQHWIPVSSEEKQRLRIEETKAEVFMHSANAITVNGDIIIGDMNGNRVVGSVLGPKLLIMVIGFNTVVKNLDEGFDRISEFATKVNAIRLGLDPNQEYQYFTLVIRRKPPLIQRGIIILVNEWLGY